MTTIPVEQNPSYSKEGLMGRIKRDGTRVAYPSAIQIELTSYCNAVCFFCAHTWSERPQQHIDSEVFRDIIDEIHSWPYKLDILYLTGLGEPMMHPKWKELYSYASGLPGAFTTNCSILKEEDIPFLYNLDFYEVAYSLDTLNPERHRKIRGFDVDRVAPKIERALEIAGDSKTRTIISTTVTYDTAQDMKEMYDWLVPKLDKVKNSLWHIKQIGHFPDIKAPLHIIPPMVFNRTIELPEHPKVFVIKEDVSLRPVCTLWFDRVTVLSNGDAVPCCHQASARQDLGNLKKTSLLDIFNSGVWENTQDKFSNKDGENGWNEIPYCKDCR